MPPRDVHDLPFRVERYDQPDFKYVVEVLATAARYVIAKAAYDAARKRDPEAPILMRDRARVVRKSTDRGD